MSSFSSTESAAHFSTWGAHAHGIRELSSRLQHVLSKFVEKRDEELFLCPHSRALSRPRTFSLRAHTRMAFANTQGRALVDHHLRPHSVRVSVAHFHTWDAHAHHIHELTQGRAHDKRPSVEKQDSALL